MSIRKTEEISGNFNRNGGIYEFDIHLYTKQTHNNVNLMCMPFIFSDLWVYFIIFDLITILSLNLLQGYRGNQ